jgi:hypothetical protein
MLVAGGRPGSGLFFFVVRLNLTAEFAVAAVRRAGRPFLGRRRAEYCPESDQPMARGMD